MKTLVWILSEIAKQQDEVSMQGNAARLDPELWELLRSHGLRATRPRMAVLGYFREEGGHHSADEVLRGLQRRELTLPRASVFGVVDVLAQAGLLRVAAAGPGRTLYEWAGASHHHFVCRVCNTVFDVPCVSDTSPCLATGDLPGQLEDAQIIFRGVCTSCG
jgi:Fur family ferric uptake transcriptional regulator